MCGIGGGGKKNGIETAQFQAVPFINFGLLFGEHPLETTVSSRSKNSEKNRKREREKKQTITITKKNTNYTKT